MRERIKCVAPVVIKWSTIEIVLVGVGVSMGPSTNDGFITTKSSPLSFANA